ncbi:MAG: hypothetical protein M0D57_04955 [Sphingobacteriales bacterium JAD_PAG50586_3]|nr:MAG: hypothetical protein M0D57_04955 [Sphingobacteriales bacterium JAD_PAG50586_3]
MNTPFRALRLQTPVSQTDLTFLLEKDNSSGLSSVERGNVTPTLRIVLLYHLVFDMPLETLVQGYKEHMRIFLQDRLTTRIEQLKSAPQTPKRSLRLAYLEQALTRLSPQI